MPLLPRTPIDREEFPLKRSLLSRILKELVRSGEIKRIAPLAEHTGCINSVSALLGEIQRAGLNAAGLEAALSARSPTFHDVPGYDIATTAPSQVEIDREIWSIYRVYEAALAEHDLTEADADQLRALSVLKGELDGRPVRVPWLDSVSLLVLDGFFDFTPIQGEIIHQLITRIPNVIVNLSWDSANPQIFRPFDETKRRLQSIAEFEVEVFNDRQPVARALAPLREFLFGTHDDIEPEPAVPEGAAEAPEQPSLFDLLEAEGPVQPGTDRPDRQIESADLEKTELAQMPPGCIRLFECDDRATEIRTIAKEIKRLIVQRGLIPSEICVVVRKQAEYADT
ncbi:MAG TPA: hypothetical protein VI756_11065, partial [Blastocatellia bacterium]